MRGIVGFLVFLLAFEYQESPTWQLGIAVGASVLGSFVGSILAPAGAADDGRRRTSSSARCCWPRSWPCSGPGPAACCRRCSWPSPSASRANTAKLAFDSIVQRDAPDANRGRSFAKFETRFQICWVIGAFLPVILPIIKIPLPARAGFLIIALTAGFAGVTYWIGRRDAAAGRRAPGRRAAAPARPREDDDRRVALPAGRRPCVDDIAGPAARARPWSTTSCRRRRRRWSTSPRRRPVRDRRPRRRPPPDGHPTRRAPRPRRRRRRRRPTQRPRRPPP